ncbi:MAG: helix-turn-helix domain-containing protein [Rhodospirillales bacterium]|nr:helix-turn-helix domain-containing protein [Rhodospirillales bacterium]
MSSKNALQKAVDTAGGQSALARACNLKQQDIWRWLNKVGKVPGEHVLAIEKATGVPRFELRPDLYPAADDEAA